MRAIKGVICLLLLMILLGLFLLWLPGVCGYEMYIVSSGSMEPEIKVGDVIFVKSIDFEELETGDIITYAMNGHTVKVTHRIKEIDKVKGMIQTKGDANEEADSNWIGKNSVIGRVEFHISHLESIVYLLSTVSGKMLMIAASLWLMALWILTDRIILRENRKEMSSY